MRREIAEWRDLISTELVRADEAAGRTFPRRVESTKTILRRGQRGGGKDAGSPHPWFFAISGTKARFARRRLKLCTWMWPSVDLKYACAATSLLGRTYQPPARWFAAESEVSWITLMGELNGTYRPLGSQDTPYEPRAR